jgi:hypothetical protein
VPIDLGLVRTQDQLIERFILVWVIYMADARLASRSLRSRGQIIHGEKVPFRLYRRDFPAVHIGNVDIDRQPAFHDQIRLSSL